MVIISANIKSRLLLVFLLIVSFFLVLFVIKSIGLWMVVADPLPEKIDVMFTFGGEGARDLYTAELMKMYTGVDWIISSHIREVDYANQYLPKNFDRRRIFFVDTCSDTRSEIMFLKEWLDKSNKNGKQNIGLISGPYHMRRISVLVRLYMKDTKAVFKYFPVPSSYYGGKFDKRHFSNWWKDKLFRFELIKTVREMIRWIK